MSAVEMPVDLSLLEKVQQIVSERLLVQVDSVDTDLLEKGALDSLSLVELLADLERTFGVNLVFADLEIDDLRTVNRIAALVARHMDAEGSGLRRETSQ